MNLEGLTLKLVTDNLNRELLGSKIYRVNMPNPHAVLLLVRRKSDTSALVADLNGARPLHPRKAPRKSRNTAQLLHAAAQAFGGRAHYENLPK